MVSYQAKKIYLFYPSYILGGAELLFLKTAELLSTHYSIEIIDIPGGFLSKNVSESIRLRFIGDNKIEIEPNCVLLTSASLALKLNRYFLKSRGNVIFWNIHPHNLIPSVSRLKWLPLIISKNKILVSILNYRYSKLIEVISGTGSICVMDEECSKSIKSFYNVQVNSILPVFFDFDGINCIRNIDKKILSNELTVAWIGRIDRSFKLPMLLRLIKDLDYSSNDIGIKIKLKIIGNGPGREIVENLSKSVNALEIIFFGEKSSTELCDSLCDVDLGFGMGQSAIEFAARGIPAILLDFSYRKISNSYRYIWLYESKGYVLGRDITSMCDPSNQGSSMSAVIESLMNEENFHGKWCREYALDNHSPNVFLRRIERILELKLTSLQEIL